MHVCTLTLLSLSVVLVVPMVSGSPVEGAVEIQAGGTQPTSSQSELFRFSTSA